MISQQHELLLLLDLSFLLGWLRTVLENMWQKG